METRNRRDDRGLNGNDGGDHKPKKGSYPSRQRRFGPAPLASFEDLPSDDQMSPEDGEDKLWANISPDPAAIERALELDSQRLLRNDDKQMASPTRTITPTCISPPFDSTKKRGSDTASQNTLKDDSATPLATTPEGKSGSFGSLLRPDKTKKTGSHHSLAPPDSEMRSGPDTKRKGSWTDIFFHRDSRGRSKSQSMAVESPRRSPTQDDAKRKKSLFRFFNFGRKSPAKELVSPVTAGRPPPGIEITDTPRVSVTDTSENEPREELIMPTPVNDPQPSEQDIIGIIEAAHSQMDHTPVDELPPGLDNNQFPSPNLRKKLRRRESTIDDDVQSLPEILPSSRSKERDLTVDDNKNVVEVTVHQAEDGHRDDRETSSLSESEVGFDLDKFKSKIAKTSSEDDFEAANLLASESVDCEDSSMSELTKEMPNLFSNFEPVKSPTRKERLEVTTIPIERPRSTTPINIAPLEAYIRSTSMSPEANLEKIRLSLPGDQFTAPNRLKSPRKSNPSIWLDFCEKGLQSPRSRRKQRTHSYTYADNNLQQPMMTTIGVADAFTPTQTLSPSPGNLTPVTPLDEPDGGKWPGFGDNFVDFNNLIPANGVNDPDRFICNCNCAKSMATSECLKNPNGGTEPSSTVEIVTSGPGGDSVDSTDNDKENSNVDLNICNESTTAGNERPEDQSTVNCHCLCHRREEFALFWKNNSTLHKQESVSSDISSASSRMIGSSSKSSPNDDAGGFNS